MKIIVAPDSFKGSLTARELCGVIRKGIHNVDSSIDVLELPLADGGEGTMENLVYATAGKTHTVEVKGPLGTPVQATYGVLGDGETVVIEMAQASGLPLISEEEKNPLIATSFGTGQLIVDALDKGYRKFIVGLGGSATNDGGAGLLRALGVGLLDENNQPITEGGAALAHLKWIDESAMDVRLSECTFTIASDVTNPLCGPEGASAVFGPQKGATPEMVKQLDEALDRFGQMIYEQKGVDIRPVPGSGAAGGMGAGLLAFLKAEIKSGIEIVMGATRFDQHVQTADFIITGEGKLDEQTLSGKVIAGVCQRAKAVGVPVIAFCGGKDLTAAQMNDLGLIAGFSIVPKPCTLQEAIDHTASWAENQVEQVMRVLMLSLR